MRNCFWVGDLNALCARSMSPTRAFLCGVYQSLFNKVMFWALFMKLIFWQVGFWVFLNQVYFKLEKISSCVKFDFFFSLNLIIMWRSQGCRSRVAVLDPNNVDLQQSEVNQSKELYNCVIMLGMLKHTWSMMIN